MPVWMQLVEASQQRLHHQVPAVDQHEQEQLQRQRDHHRRYHEHPHGHENAGDYDVEQEKRQEDDETDLERGLQLAQHEGGDEMNGAHLLNVLWRLRLRYVEHQHQVLLARLPDHELAHRLNRDLGRPLETDAAFQIRLECVAVDLRQHGLHREQRQKQREADEDRVRRRFLDAQGVPQQRQHDDDPRERSHDHEDRRRQAQNRKDRENLQRRGYFGGTGGASVDADFEPGDGERLRRGDFRREQQDAAQHRIYGARERVTDLRRTHPSDLFRFRGHRRDAAAARDPRSGRETLSVHRSPAGTA